ncbi:hypothetical protein H5410_054512 [Solanum commersonii]|uniref:Uncharacterized protein n=1 Tax=Solanum commersonii TaxID=4109 RepID=A0A9J5WFI0_SOLCO|nr:hypothetical protein H5410_054512 [Solanum commersonii]
MPKTVTRSSLLLLLMYNVTCTPYSKGIYCRGEFAGCNDGGGGGGGGNGACIWFGWDTDCMAEDGARGMLVINCCDEVNRFSGDAKGKLEVKPVDFNPLLSDAASSATRDERTEKSQDWEVEAEEIFTSTNMIVLSDDIYEVVDRINTGHDRHQNRALLLIPLGTLLVFSIWQSKLWAQRISWPPSQTPTVQTRDVSLNHTSHTAVLPLDRAMGRTYPEEVILQIIVYI